MSKKYERGLFSLLLSTSGAGLILVCLIPVVSCDRRQSGTAKTGPNPVWLQVESLKKEQRDVAGQILSRDLKPLDEAIAGPLPDSTAETAFVEPESAVALIHRASGGWSRAFDVRLGVLQASSLDKVRALIGIKETEISLGTYSSADGKPTDVRARRLRWDIWILSWPDLRPLAAEAFSGGDPDSIIGGQYGGSSVGSLPILEFSKWLSAKVKGPSRSPDQCQFSKLVYLGDTGKIALLGREDTVTIWDPAAEKDVRTFSVRGASHKLTEQRIKDLEKEGITRAGTLMSLASSPDGHRIAVGGRDDASSSSKLVTYIWDVDTARELFELTGGDDPAFSPDGTRIAVASPEKGICLWDAEHGTEAMKLAGSAGKQICGMGFTAEGASVWAAVPEGTIIFWDISTGKRLKTLEGGSATIKKVAFALRSGSAITLEEQGKFPDLTPVTRTWSFAEGKRMEALKWPGLPMGVATDRGGQRVAVYDLDAVFVFEPESRRLIRFIEPIVKLDLWDPVAFSPDGRSLALIDQSGRVSIVGIE